MKASLSLGTGTKINTYPLDTPALSAIIFESLTAP
jgi:hypothetical protein